MVGEYTPRDFNSFQLLKGCYMALELILEYALWALEKNVYFAIVGWSVLLLSSSFWLTVLCTRANFPSNCSIDH